MQAQDAQRLERVEVTGSAIKRSQVEGPVPVQVVTRKDIERTGASTINELMKSIMSLDIFDDGELSSGTPVGSGTAIVFMRGLAETNVLVLLNGRRLPINALYDSSGAGAAVDVNSIPLAAIERVEILKDGGSAIYGADAVAGVVNFITRKSYTGFELRAGYGISSRGDGEERKAGLSAGFGSLAADGYNVFAGLDLFKRDPIQRSDRDMSSSADFRRFGGPDSRSIFAPTGNYVDADFIPIPGAYVRPCPPAQIGADGLCRYDFNASLLSAYNGADRLSGMLLGTVQLTPGLQGFAEVLASRSRDTFVGHPAPDYFLDGNGDFFVGRFMQGGPRLTQRTANLLQLSTGLEGTLGEVEWKVDVGQGRSRVVNDDRNYFTYAGVDQLDASSLNNDPALVESLKVRPRREGESKILFANGKLTGELLQMPAGPLSYAVGTSVWKESIVDTPDALSQAGEIVGSIQQAAVDAERKAYAFFTELNVPVTPQLEGQVALRYDHYPSASKTSPKLAARYLFTPAFSTRASYTESFRMPSLKQLYGARESGAADFTNDTLCAAFGQPAGCTLSGFFANGSNPRLQPEKGRTYNLASCCRQRGIQCHARHLADQDRRPDQHADRRPGHRGRQVRPGRAGPHRRRHRPAELLEGPGAGAGPAARAAPRQRGRRQLHAAQRHGLLPEAGAAGRAGPALAGPEGDLRRAEVAQPLQRDLGAGDLGQHPGAALDRRLLRHRRARSCARHPQGGRPPRGRLGVRLHRPEEPAPRLRHPQPVRPHAAVQRDQRLRRPLLPARLRRAVHQPGALLLPECELRVQLNRRSRRAIRAASLSAISKAKRQLDDDAARDDRGKVLRRSMA
ncbi:TonB-dependent receptor [Methylibium sp. T29]|uniref:TonB-dependent receptor plug domain-containing protein n=1 Tax=Methylibium sp. T29 TaxID=1430884 RepID=UPI0004AF2C8E|nr:TonB-dependent receptor [Methylibium sp. T29]